jgi:CheY-like chemotaxis protein
MMLQCNTIPRHALRNCHVVVVDDEVDSLEVAARILQYYNADVHTAINGKDALRIIRNIMPRFVISDLSMPQMDGWEMLREMQMDAELSNIPVIALTAHAMRGDRERALEVGFKGYLTKPLSPAPLMKNLLQTLIRNTKVTFDPSIVEQIQE